MKKIYLDYSAGTPVDRRVLRKMIPYFSKYYGNAMSIHGLGRESKEVLMQARKKIAGVLGVKHNEIIFTSGGTESNNLAIFGIAKKYGKYKKHIITSAIDHSSVIEPLQILKKEGFKIDKLPVTKSGKVLISDLKNSLTKNTILVSIGYVNSEIGTIQDIHKMALVIKKYKEEIGRERNMPPFLHTDAIQAGRILPLKSVGIGADMITLSASKIYGPKGVGILYKKDNIKISPQILGGGQEDNMRSGTENIPGIVGIGYAMEIADKSREKDAKHSNKLKRVFIKKIKKIVPEAIVCGDIKNGAPHIISIVLPNFSGEQLVIELEMMGIYVSSGSACTQKETNISHVIKAIPNIGKYATNSIRFSTGRNTTIKDIKKAVKQLSKIVKELRLRQASISK